MKEIGTLIFLYTETPLHAGSGTTFGAVDLPIQRERISGLPLVQGSGIKGALRDTLRHIRAQDEGSPKNLWLTLFGPEPPRAGHENQPAGGLDDSKKAGPPPEPSDFGGAMSVLDARLLLFPARTVWGSFAWLTSPMVLSRIGRDLELLGQKAPEWTALSIADDKALVSSKPTVVEDGSLLVEDLAYCAQCSPHVDALAAWLCDHALPKMDSYQPFRDRIAAQLAVVSDAELQFLTQHATEVITRIRIDPDTGTVQEGALWSEESLPSESLLWSVAFFAKSRRPKEDAQKGAKLYDATDLCRHFSQAVHNARIRLGGDRTTGRGIVGVNLLAGSER